MAVSKFKFSIIDQRGTNLLDFIFNSDFGLRILNHLNKDQKIKQDFYLDVDLDFRRTTKHIFLVIHERKLYVAINGLSFADVIFVDSFPDPFDGISEYYAKVDADYTTQIISEKTQQAVIAHSISPNLAA